MAALDILWQPTKPRQLILPSPSSAFQSNYATVATFYYFNNNYLSKCRSYPLGTVSKTTPAKARAKLSFSSQMLPQTSSSSGTQSSWIQDNSACGDCARLAGQGPGPLHSVFPTRPAQVSSVKDLFDFICQGPLINKLGLTSEKVAESIDKWLLYGSKLCRLFQLNELDLTEPQKVRIYHYYVPVFLWCEEEISHHMSMFKEGEDVPPLVIGFSAPQGCGKTTLVFALDCLFRMTGRNAATISIDDFYLTAEDQAKLRESNPGNALLEVVLFEGWMLGFKPLPSETVKAVDPQLETVNKNLEAYYDVWDKFVNSWVVIKIQDPSYVYQWRLQAEIAMRNDGKPGMSDVEVMDFVSRYLPAYKAYLPTLYSEGPSGSDPKHTLVIEIDEGRNPILGC